MRLPIPLIGLVLLLSSLESPMNLQAKEPDFDDISEWIERQLLLQ